MESFTKIQFDRVLDAKDHHKADFCSVLLKSEHVIKNSVTLLLDKEGFVRKRFAIVVISKDLFNKLNLKSGDDFVQALINLGGDYKTIYANGARLVSTEITESEFNKLSEKARAGYQKKMIPADSEKGTPAYNLLYNGEQIYFKNEFVPISEGRSGDVLKTPTTKEVSLVEVPNGAHVM